MTMTDGGVRRVGGPVAQRAVETPERLVRDLLTAFSAYDDASAHQVVDRALSALEVEDVVDLVFFPALRHLGDAWESGVITVAQEHYSSSLVRSRMLGMIAVASPASAGEGPVAVLACPTHERHDIGLLALDLVLRRQGWQVAFLGADTPVLDAVAVAGDVAADVLVLCGTEPHMYAAQLDQHAAALARAREATGIRLALGGRGVTTELADRLDGIVLPLDPRQAAAALVAAPA